MKKRKSQCIEVNSIFENEIIAYSKIDHPNIIKLIDFSLSPVSKPYKNSKSKKSKQVKFLALEYAENGELMEYICKTGSFAETTARYFFQQLISAIEHINKKGLSHQDIKPQNIMLDAEFNLKLADFGFATDKKVNTDIQGTLSYMAPEILAELPYIPKQVDIFAAAVILFMMVTQRLPFLRADPDDEYYSFIIIKDFKGFWDLHAQDQPEILNLSNKFKDFFCKIVVANGKERPKIKKIKKHPWYQKSTPTHQEIYENFSYRKLVKNEELEVEDIPNTNSIVYVLNSPEEHVKLFSDEKKEIQIALQEMEKMPKKYTQYFKCRDGDFMIQEVINFSKMNKYSHKI